MEAVRMILATLGLSLIGMMALALGAHIASRAQHHRVGWLDVAMSQVDWPGQRRPGQGQS
jgi:hypothetical protein